MRAFHSARTNHEPSLNAWRSMLFIPAHREKFTEKAHQRGADACILDLEDSVSLDEKANARQKLAAASEFIVARSVDVLVRINNDTETNAQRDMLCADLESAALASVSALVIPKVADADILRFVSDRLAALESQRGLPSETIKLIAQIEDVHALSRLDDIAIASPRLIGMSLGSEDFSVSAGMQPTPEALYLPNQMVVFACRRAGILPFGFPASIADYSNLEAFRAYIRRASEMGFVGAFCIHPSQISPLNEGFSPSEQELADARRILAAADVVQGQGAFALDGKMIDPPIVRRAREILNRATRTPSKYETQS